MCGISAAKPSYKTATGMCVRKRQRCLTEADAGRSNKKHPSTRDFFRILGREYRADRRIDDRQFAQ